MHSATEYHFFFFLFKVKKISGYLSFALEDL